MKPEESLVLKIEELPIPDDSPDLLSRGPWVRLSVLNKSPNRWYYDMEAQDHGLRLIVADNDDNAVPLNQVGKNKALFKSLDNSRRRIGVFRSEYAATVDIGLADYCKLVPGRSYSVIVEWALNVHDIRPPRKPLEEEWTHRITLKSESIVVKKAAK